MARSCHPAQQHVMVEHEAALGLLLAFATRQQLMIQLTSVASQLPSSNSVQTSYLLTTSRAGVVP